MARFVRRHSALASLVSSFSLLAVVACTGEEEPAGASPAPITEPTPEADAAAPESNDVVVKLASTFGFADGKLTEKPVAATVEMTIHAVVDGSSRAFAATKRADGAFVFVGVPRAPYVLETRTTWATAIAGDPPVAIRYPLAGERSVLLGSDYWARQDVTMMTDDTKLALSVNAPREFRDGDTFSWVGLHSYFYRTAGFYEGETEGVANAPAHGATASQNWTLDGHMLGAPYGMEASGLPVSSANDDLLVYQNRTRAMTTPTDESDAIARFRPWSAFKNSETIGVLHVPSPSFVNGATNTVTGTLAAPVTERITVDFHGTSYASLRDAAHYPKTTSSSASIGLTQEAGPGPMVYNSIAPTPWLLSTSAKKRPIDLSCFPNPKTTTCVPASCEVGCANATDGYLDPDDLLGFELDAARVYDKGMRDFYSVSYSYSLSTTLPDGATRTLSASVSEAHPRASNTAAFSLELGPPVDITLDGQTLPWEVSAIADDHAPVVAFSRPTQGNPEYFRIEVIDITPDLGKDIESPRRSLTVANLYTHETTAALPMDVLRAGHVYYLRVSSAKEGWNFSARAPRETTARTSVFTPPFVFGKPVTN